MNIDHLLGKADYLRCLRRFCLAELYFSSKKNKRAGVAEILSDGEKLSVTEDNP